LTRKQEPDTRDRLIQAASELIYSQGFSATGVAPILEKAGAGASSFYHFFESKEDLLIAVLERYGERLEEEIVGPTREEYADPVDRAFGILDFYREFLAATRCRLGCPMGNLSAELADSHPRVRERIQGLFEAWRRAVADCFREIEGELPEGVDPESLGALFLSVMEGGVMQARVARSLKPFETTYWYLRDYVNRLLGRDEEVL
jgi:TetR/AcrR family transcriptional repressor of nem operon